MDINEQELKRAAAELTGAIENNKTDNPHLSIDPETEKMTILGDPEKVDVPRGTYEVIFSYEPDEITEEDKTRMKLNPKTRCYEACIHYENKRIKPLYRGRIVVVLTNLMSEVGTIKLDGYTSNVAGHALGSMFYNHTDEIAELARIILDLPKDQVAHMTPSSLVSFFVQIFKNEPNIMAECTNFLSS